MNGTLFPLAFPTEELRLLTGLGIGFLFGFVLERAGFGNARKLAGQFYLSDMTVFKVMFTAILVAMFGLFGLQAVGMVDLSLIWINPTFLPSQVVGGFLLGVGFIMSGLCPGTSVVSMVSGRIDAWVTFLGIFLGLALFTVAVEWFPALDALYHAGAGEVSFLHQLLGVPALGLALVVLVVALAAFVGAEKVEAIFQRRAAPVELTPPSRPRVKLALAGALGVVGITGLALTTSPLPLPQPQMASLSPLALADALIQREPGIVILDLRVDPQEGTGIPGAVASAEESVAAEVLWGAPRGTTVVVYDESGIVTRAPATWPPTLDYRFVEGGWRGWEQEVLTPASPSGTSLEERERTLRQNQIAAFFSGAAVQATPMAAPPPAMSAGPAPKKKGGGC